MNNFSNISSSSNTSTNNSSSSSSSSTKPPVVVATDLFVTVLTYVDYVNRIVSMLIFITYLVLVIKLPFLRHKSLLYVHHSNLCGFLFCVMYIFYYTSTAPATSSAYLNTIFCVMSEVTWSMLKYLRSYSILLIAIYRLTAVFFINAFKLLNSHYAIMAAPIFLVWLFACVAFLATKYGFQTTYGSLFCIDGYSPTSTDQTVNYLIVTSIISILIPFVSISVIYLLIKRRLSITEAQLNKQQEGKSLGGSGFDFSMAARAGEDTYMPPTPAQANSPSLTGGNTFGLIANNSSMSKQDKPLKQRRYELRKTKRLNKQLIAVMICYLLSFVVAFVLNFRYIIPDFNARFYHFRQILRILNVFFQSLIPIVSLYFNPHLTRMLKRFRRRRRRNSYLPNNNINNNNNNNNMPRSGQDQPGLSLATPKIVCPDS